MLNETLFDFDSSIFEILNISGLAVVVTDNNQQIVMFNGRFAEWLGQSADHWKGKQWLELPLEASDTDDGEYLLFAPQRSEPIKLNHWQHALPSQSSLTAHFFLQANHHQREQRTQTTHASARPSWNQFLDYEVSRSRRYDNPLALLKLKPLNWPNPAEPVAEPIIRSILELMRDELRWADMVSHADSGEFLIVLPETPADALPNLRLKMEQAITARVSKLADAPDLRLVIGQATWHKGDTSQRLLDRARADLIEQLRQLMNELNAD